MAKMRWLKERAAQENPESKAAKPKAPAKPRKKAKKPVEPTKLPEPEPIPLAPETPAEEPTKA